jgi:hypothetical protein
MKVKGPAPPLIPRQAQRRRGAPSRKSFSKAKLLLRQGNEGWPWP